MCICSSHTGTASSVSASKQVMHQSMIIQSKRGVDPVVTVASLSSSRGAATVTVSVVVECVFLSTLSLGSILNMPPSGYTTLTASYPLRSSGLILPS